MAFIRRGYVPQNIPIEAAVTFTLNGIPWSVRPFHISCFEEHVVDVRGKKQTKLYTMDGSEFAVDEQFEEVKALLKEKAVPYED